MLVMLASASRSTVASSARIAGRGRWGLSASSAFITKVLHDVIVREVTLEGLADAGGGLDVYGMLGFTCFGVADSRDHARCQRWLIHGALRRSMSFIASRIHSTVLATAKHSVQSFAARGTVENAF